MDKDKDKLIDFLKTYVEILKEGVDISKDLPLLFKICMPSGGIEICTNDGRSVAFVAMDEGGGPSMPVGPAAMTYAKLFTTLVNKYHKLMETE